MIEKGSKVCLHFVLVKTDGQVVESTYERGNPVDITIGDGHLPENFESHLFGLNAGDKQQWELSPEQAFGKHSNERLSYFTRDQFPSDETLQTGMVMGFSQPNGAELPGIIQAIEGDSVTVDFNHPLAGEPIIFAVEIISCDAPVRR
ncbi:FKBP-type peptidyl-prolyl cis-trans isomerase [Celerinatantimonas diazotrophica]|uniref:Peptidyl-prolyl cis-trans isomerase n=1 Tax=Celerinatantimonas diazotrophica TaxID=412034 RepID=A0A4R1J8Y2_9GAMM|nr:FKBP-type peptidyl-prolyl cis-trans isomerase [Celerinatantimonas diazotrophica]TCK47042.1 FKBP-type peptidyl-prolyl cis-trans isomerase SlpA [Celerinatantimonas diazotrophica]CAG9295810.1 FKBP-type 16 kDa peptidyl-prolyl cis-trans isomerase [Celerinatantimonas diazotrophica]